MSTHETPIPPTPPTEPTREVGGAETGARLHAEWAIQCHASDGSLFTGRPFTSREEALRSGHRLTSINGADWWLVARSVTTYAPRLGEWEVTR